MSLFQPKQIQFISKQQGFTYIELSIIFMLLSLILILSIPHFLGETVNGRIEMMKSIESEMRSANRMIYAKAAINDVQTVANCLDTQHCDGHLPVMLNNQPVQTQYGYAYDVFALAVVLDSASMLHVKIEEKGFHLQHRDAIDGSGCSISYQPANHNHYPLKPPHYDLNVSHCD